MLEKIKTYLLNGTDIVQTSKRFPLPLICIILLSFISLSDNHDYDFAQTLIDNYVPYALICSFIWLLTTSLCFEIKKVPLWLKLSAQLIPCLLIFTYSLNIDFKRSFLDFSSLATHYTFILAFILLSSALPYLLKKNQEKAYWHLTYALKSNFTVSTLFSIVIIIGLLIAHFALRRLFNLDPNDFFGDLMFLTLNFFLPFHFLAKTPQDLSFASNTKVPQALEFLAKFVLTPLIIIYLLIIYAYTIKIALSGWQLPQGEIVFIITGFAYLGISVHLIAYPLEESKSLILRLFYKYFYYTLLVPLGLSFWAILVRINQHGITESRYLVFIINIWFLITAAYYIFRQKHKPVIYISITLSALLFISSVGALNMSSISTASQFNRLKGLLTKNGALVEGKLTQAKRVVSEEDFGSIYSKLSYLLGKKEYTKLTSILRDDFKIDYDNSRQKIEQEIMNEFEWITGIDLERALEYKEYINLRFEYPHTLEVSGYDYVEDWHPHDKVDNTHMDKHKKIKTSMLEGYDLIIKDTETDKEASFNLKDFIEKSKAENPDISNYESIEGKLLPIKLEGRKVAIKFNHITGTSYNDGSIEIKGIDADFYYSKLKD